MFKQKVLTSFLLLFYSIYGIKKIYFKFFFGKYLPETSVKQLLY